MGNCQAIDNATLVIQYPCGRVEKLYWPVTASDIMKMNPGHYVALLLTTTTLCPSNSTTSSAATVASDIPVRITRIKLLRPTDTLVLGHIYRLISAQEVLKGLWEKKYAKMKKKESESEGGMKHSATHEVFEPATRRADHMGKSSQVIKHERQRSRTVSAAHTVVAAKSKAWQPSLQSISEATL